MFSQFICLHIFKVRIILLERIYWKAAILLILTCWGRWALVFRFNASSQLFTKRISSWMMREKIIEFIGGAVKLLLMSTLLQQNSQTTFQEYAWCWFLIYLCQKEHWIMMISDGITWYNMVLHVIQVFIR